MSGVVDEEDIRRDPIIGHAKDAELLVEDTVSSSSETLRNWWRVRTMKGFFRSFVSRILIVYTLLTVSVVMIDWWGARSSKSPTPQNRSSQPRGGQTVPRIHKTWWRRIIYAAAVAGLMVGGLLLVLFYGIDPSTFPVHLFTLGGVR